MRVASRIPGRTLPKLLDHDEVTISHLPAHNQDPSDILNHGSYQDGMLHVVQSFGDQTLSEWCFQQWTRLIRFVAVETSQVHIGQPVDPQLDSEAVCLTDMCLATYAYAFLQSA